MSLPPGFLDELRSRISLARVVGRKVTWDSRKSNQAKGDLWAPCPFHQEKTASFHVDDRQGYYYCFGCHAKGDAISFVRETENVGFVEAIEILAREAGMPMPARDPEAAQRADRRTTLAQVMEQAVAFYRLQLKTGLAAEARAYLARRGLDEAAQARFEIGFAPDRRTALAEALAGKGIAPDLLQAAGLTAVPEGGGLPYDRFRGRIIFPIRDARGRCTGLGGRALDPKAPAKYLNSPQTDLFDKGRSLYNHGPAREAAGKGKVLIVAEGYMDVIALAEAGFAAVAPLGTAITEDQLGMIWQIHPEPVIALDGDAAGIRAARRLVDLALPRVEAGRGLRFALLPDALDPDDLIRNRGAAAMQAVVDAARPMVDLLWQRETEGKVFDSPERKATLDRSLREMLSTIRDDAIRAHYRDEIARLRRALFAPEPAGRFRPPRAAPVRSTTRASPLVAGTPTDEMRQALVLAVVLAHPDLAADFAAGIEEMDLDGELAAIRQIVLTRAEGVEVEATVALEKLMSHGHLRIAPALRAGADLDVARLCLAEELAKLAANRGFAQEIREAAEDIETAGDEGLTWRLAQAADARNKAVRAETEDRATFDVAPSGARVARDEREAFEALIARIAATPGRRD